MIVNTIDTKINGVYFCSMGYATTLQMRLTPELKSAIDELRKSEPDLPSRSEMIRRLIERASRIKRKKP